MTTGDRAAAAQALFDAGLSPACRFGDAPASVHVLLESGCVCWPADKDQWLCAHHEWKAEPLGAMWIDPIAHPDAPPEDFPPPGVVVKDKGLGGVWPEGTL